MSDTVTLRKYLTKIIELNDRRYTEVNIEKEKALKIKEEADKVALSLARDIQTYKDEKANELREQINSERGIYATKVELKPITDYISSLQGQSRGSELTWSKVYIAIASAGVIAAFIGHFIK